MDLPTVPTIILEILKQFPALILCWLAVTRVARYLGDSHNEVVANTKIQHDHLVETLQAQHRQHLADVCRGNDEHLRSKDAEIQRLIKALADVQRDRDRLLKRIAPEGEA